MPEQWDPLLAFRTSVLQQMRDLEPGKAKELSKVNGVWLAYKREITALSVADPMGFPGQARKHFEVFIWSTPDWKHFKAVRDRRRQSRPEAKAKKATYDKARYDAIKIKRAQPEERERINRLRRERYARSKEQQP